MNDWEETTTDLELENMRRARTKRTMLNENTITAAIADPGAVVGPRYENETVPRWSTRAVLTILSVELGGVIPHVDEPPYSDSWNH